MDIQFDSSPKQLVGLTDTVEFIKLAIKKISLTLMNSTSYEQIIGNSSN